MSQEQIIFRLTDTWGTLSAAADQDPAIAALRDIVARGVRSATDAAIVTTTDTGRTKVIRLHADDPDGPVWSVIYPRPRPATYTRRTSERVFGGK